MKKYIGVLLQNILIGWAILMGVVIYLEVSDSTMSDTSQRLVGAIIAIIAVISAFLITGDKE